MLNFAYVIAGVFIVVISASLTRAMITLDILDVPNRRSSHEKPTPKSGGVAIAVAFVVGLISLYWLQQMTEPMLGLYPDQFALFAGLAAVIAAVAFIDDLFNLLPFSKLAAQAIAALVFALSIAHIETIFVPGQGNVALGSWGYLLTVVWIIFFMNAFNFMDGIDGIAGGCTVVACFFLGIVSVMEGAHFVVVTCFCLGAATLGFLRFNFPNGKIFMGDAGSQFIGFVMAALAVFGSSLDQGQLSIYLVPIIFFPFIFDVVVTLIYRALRGQNVLRAHREHLYQIGVSLGASHVEVSLMYFVLVALCGCVAIAVQAAQPADRFLLIFGLVPIFLVLAGMVYRRGLRAGLIEPFFNGRRRA